MQTRLARAVLVGLAAVRRRVEYKATCLMH